MKKGVSIFSKIIYKDGDGKWKIKGYKKEEL
jgi:hypothetical protein